MRKVVIASRCAWTLFNFRLNLIEAISKTGAAVVASGAPKDGYEQKLVGRGISFLSAPLYMGGVSPWRDLLLIAHYCWFFALNRPTVYHAFTIKPIVYGIPVAALVGVKRRVCTVTGLGYGFMSKKRWLEFLVGRMYRLAFSLSHVIFFQNDDDLRYFRDRGLVDIRKVKIVPGSGVDLERFRFRPIETGLPERPMRFLMVARLLKHKGVNEYVAAAEQLRESGLNCTFQLVGGEDASNPSTLSLSVLRESTSAVEFVGEVADVRPFLERADVVVLPSYREGAPRSLLEAMAVGRPIITTDAPGCRDVWAIAPCGALVPVKDAHALAREIEAMIHLGSGIIALGDAAFRGVVNHYDERQVIRTFQESYQIPINAHAGC